MIMEQTMNSNMQPAKEEQRHNLPPKHRMNARQSGLRTENKSLSPAIVTAISIYS